MQRLKTEDRELLIDQVKERSAIQVDRGDEEIMGL